MISIISGAIVIGLLWDYAPIPTPLMCICSMISGGLWGFLCIKLELP